MILTGDAEYRQQQASYTGPVRHSGVGSETLGLNPATGRWEPLYHEFYSGGGISGQTFSPDSGVKFVQGNPEETAVMKIIKGAAVALGLGGLVVGAAGAAGIGPAAASGAAAPAPVSGASIAASASAPLMPPAIVDTAAIGAMSSGGGIAAALTDWAVGGASKIAQNVAASYVMRTLMPTPARPSPTTIAPQAHTGGRTMLNDETIDWSRLGDLGVQLLVNSLSPNPPQPQPVQVAAAMPVTLPGLGALGALGNLGGLAAGMVGGAARAAVGVMRSVGGRIVGWMLPSGQKVTRAQAVALAKNVGLSAAAGALGASVTDLAEAVMQEEGRKRRRRGISASDLARTTRTMGRVERMHRRIAKAARAHAR